jgi:hypothetical protein
MHRVLRCRHSWQLLVPFRMRFAGRSSDMARVATEDQNASEQKLRISAAAAAFSDGGRNQTPSTPHSFVLSLTCSPTFSHCTLTQL